MMTLKSTSMVFWRPKLSGYSHTYEEELISPEALATLQTGKNVMAIHCRQGTGDQYIDAGIVGLAG
jgi:hypothetical protein